MVEESLEKTDQNTDIMGFDPEAMDGMESMVERPELLKMPFLMVCATNGKHAKSPDNPDGIEPGMIYNSMTKQYWKELDIIFIGSGFARSRRDPNDKRKSICWSNDGRMPSPQVAKPPSKSCDNCKNNRDYNRGEEGDCGLQHKWLVMAAEPGPDTFTGPAVLMHGNTNFSPANDLMNKYYQLKKNLRSMIITITTEWVDRNNYKWWALLMHDEKHSTPEQQQKAKAIWTKLKGQAVQSPDDANSESSTESQSEDSSEPDDDVPF